MKRICSDCNKVFEISAQEEMFYRSKNLDLPKRCKACRNKRNGKNSVTIVSKNPKCIFGGFLFILLSGILYFISDYLSFQTWTKILSCSGCMLLSLICFLVYKRKRIIDYSFNNSYNYSFYDAQSLYTHFKKHGKETNCTTAQQYLEKANNIITNKNAAHHKTKDNDNVYFIKKTGDFVVLSNAKYIRSYYKTTYNYYLKQ